MEAAVTRPIEKSLASVKNVKKLSSTSAEGPSYIMLEFDWGTDLAESKNEIREALDLVRSTLPDDITEPLLFAFDISSQPILYLTVESSLHGPAELRRISENDVEPRLERIMSEIRTHRKRVAADADPAPSDAPPGVSALG